MTALHLLTKFCDDQVYIELAKYHDNTTAIRFVDVNTFEPVAIATVCLSKFKEVPAEGNVFIKDWSENEGMLKCLQDAGILGEQVREVATGFVMVQECPLLLSPDDDRILK
ncbi:hypothetical protein CL65_gp071 [Mycobacterium phage Patience]|uniref:Uncharacterized protein n=1 Tax=Mycobacterium phage Patience TaxID=1074308 RepID=G1JWI1_9CAUD|nr:hypothetical protein CL65_gp071 [Mycobacterium phage Patience]AEL97979.1 hypothetical protein PATIENCE_70 [Mycobacterium phage Patience]UOW93395.1 hypothetical protein SEA_LABELLE_69 [Mycobacterium phage Labelle]